MRVKLSSMRLSGFLIALRAYKKERPLPRETNIKSRVAMKKLNVGIVGIGAQTLENLLPALLQIADVQIIAACDSILSRAELVRGYLTDVKIFTDVEVMLSAVEIEALVLACPPEAHRDISLLAISRGINVFVEKPPCFTLSELRELVKAAEHNKVVTAVGLNFRFARPIQQIRQITSGGLFGKARHLQINHYANKPRAPLWGMNSTLRSFLLAQAIHSIDLATVFAHSAITHIDSVVQREKDALLARINIQFASGMSSSILTGTMFPYFEFELKIVSDHSTMITLDNLWGITVHEVGYSSPMTGKDKRWRSTWQPGPLDSGYERSGYLGELIKFFESIREGRDFEGSFLSMIPTFEVIEHVCKNNSIQQEKISSIESNLRNETVEMII